MTEKEMSLEQLDAQIEELQRKRENYSKVQEVRKLLSALQNMDVELQIQEAIDLISDAADYLNPPPVYEAPKPGRKSGSKPRLLVPINRALRENGPLSFGELMKAKSIKAYTAKNPVSEERFHNALDEAVTSGKVKFTNNKYHSIKE